jgi:hypothetical protein
VLRAGVEGLQYGRQLFGSVRHYLFNSGLELDSDSRPWRG